MKMAKASSADLEMAMELSHALEALSNRWSAAMPERIAQSADDDHDEAFSIDDEKQCRRVCEYLIKLTRSASLFRVVMGMAVLLDPANKIVDPDADTLEHHPEVEQLMTRVETIENLLLWVLYHHQGGSSTVGQPIRRFFGFGQFDHLTPEQVERAKKGGA